MSGRAWAVWWGGEVAAGSAAATALAATVRAATTAAAARGGEAELVLAAAPQARDVASAWLDVVLAESGGSRVLLLEHECLARRTPAATVALLRAAVASAGDVHTLCLAHDYDAIDLCGLLAHQLDAVVVTAACGLRSVDGELRVQRPVHGGRFLAELRIVGSGPLVMTVPRTAFATSDDTTAHAAPARGRVELVRFELDGDPGPVGPDRQVLDIEEPASAPALAAAERVVSVGRGLGGPEHLPLARGLAAALAAELAGSRPVIDAGWLPPERQVGSSGQTVSPALYVALGISGAAQHLEGMSGTRCVVAINRDPDAPIFRAARYGIVGDLHAVVPELIAALGEPSRT